MCGTQDGVLDIWTWGRWGDMNDRFPGGWVDWYKRWLWDMGGNMVVGTDTDMPMERHVIAWNGMACTRRFNYHAC